MQVVERATHLLDEWREYQNIKSRIAATSSSDQQGSSNIDASFSSATNMVGICICLRDSADSKKGFDQFRLDIEDNSEFDCIISACINLFHNKYQNSYVKFNRRQVNEVVHKLAHVALSHASSHIYTDVPSCIRHIVANEKQ
ncbi:hypothetical protein MTR_1g057740 [Medicago truncatula]|uniref:Uncharacterized protein n=1 Tax=Medicago truncatula TaxID=3880 RepID=A0A072VKJ7_MEDTR|nr:hypothetical protein MTR_1g057740 [Medicago truncatula]